MRRDKYGKYFISEPRVENVAYHPVKNVKGVTFPDEIYLDGEIIEGSPVVVDIGWRFRIPEPDPVEWTHTHDFDEVCALLVLIQNIRTTWVVRLNFTWGTKNILLIRRLQFSSQKGCHIALSCIIESTGPSCCR